jgi:hypothetical protein|tara:strand:+ start:144 stop:446 length:303 start_codon:yes stop_codon:yes gene_type:complete
MTYREQINYDDMSSALREAGVSFEDTTWGNDVTASISVLLDTGCGLHFEEEFQIYIPNSDTFDPENECFNTFAVTLIEQGRTCDFRRPEEVIDYLQSFTN